MIESQFVETIFRITGQKPIPLHTEGQTSYIIKRVNKLKSTKAIEQVFKEGHPLFAYPIKCVVIKSDDFPQTSIGVSVSKKLFSKAVERNRIKRLMRESSRLLLKDGTAAAQGFQMMCIYVGKSILDFRTIHKANQKIWKKASYL